MMQVAANVIIHGPSPWHFPRTLCLVLLLMAMSVPSVFAEELRGQKAVEAGRESLGGKTKFPWYDPQTDDLRRLNVKASDDASDPVNRSTNWESQPSAPTTRTINSTGSVFWNMMQGLFWLLLFVLFGLLIWFLVWAFLNRESQGAVSSGSTQEVDEHGDVDRIENLPFQVKRPQSDLLAEARRQYEAGNFSEAVIYFYSYLLVEMDKRHLIRLAKGKTNRQYLWEVRSRGPLMPLVETTMFAFEDVFFGQHRLDRERFEQCWRRLDDFHQLVEQGAGS
jgi:hypothetical protein